MTTSSARLGRETFDHQKAFNIASIQLRADRSKFGVNLPQQIKFFLVSNTWLHLGLSSLEAVRDHAFELAEPRGGKGCASLPADLVVFLRVLGCPARDLGRLERLAGADLSATVQAPLHHQNF